ncbi:MAG: hypothetical protein DMG70_05745 [Acidobacteria bacterium]|nr:MAG: hypothetical protein DMG70_05745 [Acidobacteriota bacterium]
MTRFTPDFCLTFVPGCSAVPAADADMLLLCKSPSTITAWFLTYPLVNLCVSSFLIFAIRLSSLEISGPGQDGETITASEGIRARATKTLA